MGDSKMSKSLGNLVAVSEALEHHTADAFRLMFLSTHYTSPQTYSEEKFNSMERAAERLRTPLRAPANDGAGESVDPSPYRQQFLEAMEADLNTPQALAALFDLGREINRASEEGKSVQQAQETLTTLSGVLGLTLEDTRQRGTQQVEPFVDLLARDPGATAIGEAVCPSGLHTRWTCRIWASLLRTPLKARNGAIPTPLPQSSSSGWYRGPFASTPDRTSGELGPLCMLDPALVSSIKQIVGEEHVLTDAA